MSVISLVLSAIITLVIALIIGIIGVAAVNGDFDNISTTTSKSATSTASA